jgi:DnaA family protein
MARDPSVYHRRMTAGQLPLTFPLPPTARLDTFVAGKNAAAVGHVTELATGASHGTVWLWAQHEGAGKTHLLQAACRAADAAGRRAMYLALPKDHSAHPEMLAGLDVLDLLAIDDVQHGAGDPASERALFDVLNTYLGRSAALLLAAPASPAAAAFQLPDLASRAAGAVVYRLQPLEDEGRREALLAHARARGIELEPAAADYLLQRVTRGMRELAAWLERLDRESLIAQRRVTIPFIRSLLKADE